jgi:hypothetical protein
VDARRRIWKRQLLISMENAVGKDWERDKNAGKREGRCE